MLASIWIIVLGNFFFENWLRLLFAGTILIDGALDHFSICVSISFPWTNSDFEDWLSVLFPGDRLIDGALDHFSVCVVSSSLGHANLLCRVPISCDVPRRSARNQMFHSPSEP